jgi:hypothetical protein
MTSPDKQAAANYSYASHVKRRLNAVKIQMQQPRSPAGSRHYATAYKQPAQDVYAKHAQEIKAATSSKKAGAPLRNNGKSHIMLRSFDI